MPRPNYPTKLRDPFGAEIRLPSKPFATGGEGAIFDVVGRPELVAKLYSKPQSRERCDKLSAMARLCSPDLLKIAAWPTATLSNGNPLVVQGILMPRISDHQEIHHLYSVAQRKKNFPEVDWGFLLHTARNCAIAFENIHSHGHVVGDVNQKNVMVSKKGIVALVDCDSFQVKDGTRIFRCNVGVPEYTPPELHGKKFSETDRNANHDLFGLAVIVFHLLMMGRHPFAGVPQGNTDIQIEKAIQDYLYAYARNPTKLKQPPHVPPIGMLDAPTRDLFEKAFSSSQRPTATEWRRVLDDSMNGLQRCKNDLKHAFPAAAGNCPWCRLIAVDRLLFFLPSPQGVSGSTLRIEDIQRLIHQLTAMKPAFPVYTRPKLSSSVQVMLPAGLSKDPEPVLLPHLPVPGQLRKPKMEPFPPFPVLPLKPELFRLPAPPVGTPRSILIPHPPAPVDPPRPQLQVEPVRPAYPPIPIPDPPDRTLEWFALIFALVGLPVYFIAWPVGVVVVIAFGTWWLSIKATEGMRHRSAEEGVRTYHQAKCAMIDAEHSKNVWRIMDANEEFLNVWHEAKSLFAAKHVDQCSSIDEQNRRRLAPWEAKNAAIQKNHERVRRQIEETNLRAFSDWEAEKMSRLSAFEKASGQIKQENQRRISEWEKATASRSKEYHEKCIEIDVKNLQKLATWKLANAPWIREEQRWRDRALAAQAEIKQLEDELVSQRSSTAQEFQQRKGKAEVVLKSHDATRQDYERELRHAEMNTRKVQLELYLDKSLIRNAKLKGITGDRILSLESFGIETAKDVDILKNQKVPGIGTVLSNRLFEWRDRLASSFRPQQGLPESEKSRIAMRYAPVLRSLAQTVEAAISDLDTIAKFQTVREAEQVKAIAAAVQKLAVADAHLQKMAGG